MAWWKRAHTKTNKQRGGRKSDQEIDRMDALFAKIETGEGEDLIAETEAQVDETVEEEEQEPGEEQNAAEEEQQEKPTKPKRRPRFGRGRGR